MISAVADSCIPLQHMISRMARTAHLQTEDFSHHRMKRNDILPNRVTVIIKTYVQSFLTADSHFVLKNELQYQQPAHHHQSLTDVDCQTFVLHQQNQFVTAYLTKLASCNCLQTCTMSKTLFNTISEHDHPIIHYPGL
jgi:hypothetical protein